MPKIILGFEGSRGGELSVRKTPFGEIGIIEDDQSVYFPENKLDVIIRALKEVKNMEVKKVV